MATGLMRAFEKLFDFLFYNSSKAIQRALLICALRIYWRFRKYIAHLIYIYFGHVSPKHIYDWGIHSFFLEHIHSSMTVLDIGCGAGELTTKIAKKAKRVVAYDKNRNLIDIARQRSRSEGILNIEYFVGDALRDLPVPSRYDVVILSSILTFVPEPKIFLDRLHNVTNCLLIRETRFDDSYLALLSKEFRVNKSLYFEYTKDELVNLLAGAGWKVVDSWDTYDIFLKAKPVQG